MYFDFLARQENLQYYYDEMTSPNIPFEGIELKENVLWNSLVEVCDNQMGADFAASIPFSVQTRSERLISKNWIKDKTPEEVIEQMDNDRAMMFGITE